MQLDSAEVGQPQVLLTMVLGGTYGPHKPLTDAATTPFSSGLIGAVGPLISPLIQLTQSFTAIAENFRQGKVPAALNEMFNIPANVLNAMLNGGTFLNLTGVAKALGGTLPPKATSIGQNFGRVGQRGAPGVPALACLERHPTVNSVVERGG